MENTPKLDASVGYIIHNIQVVQRPWTVNTAGRLESGIIPSVAVCL